MLVDFIGDLREMMLITKTYAWWNMSVIVPIF